MEDNSLKDNFMQRLMENSNPNLQALIVSFLDRQTIQLIYTLVKHNQKKKQFFFVLVTLQFLLGTYINKADRSMFFIFYQQPQFMEIQRKTFLSLASTQANEFEKYPQLIEELISFIRKQLEFMKKQLSKQQLEQTINQIIESFETKFFEPDLPLPKLKKQTVGMFCQSIFQLFLTQKKFPCFEENFPSEGMQQFEKLLRCNMNFQNKFIQIVQSPQVPTLQKKVQQKKIQQNLESQVMKQKIQKKKTQILQQYINDNLQQQISPFYRILIVRYCGKFINYKNYKYLLIDGLQLHNIIVAILALTDITLEIYDKIIKFHNDPFMKYVEFVLRANIYRNMILGIEDNFKFIFETYDNLFTNTFKEYQEQPTYDFWFPAMGKWVKKMDYHHPHMQKIYQYIVTKQRKDNLLQFIKLQNPSLPSIYKPIKNKLQEQQFLLDQRKQIYGDNDICVQQFFRNHEECYDMIAKDYLEYLVDTSVNQYTVHWCGSSKQVFPEKSPYMDFHKGFLIYQKAFMQYISEIANQNNKQKLSMTILRQLFQNDLEFINTRFIRQRTSKQLLESFNEQVKKKIQSEGLSQSIVFPQETHGKYIVTFDFGYRDNLLTHFNEKEEISDNDWKENECLYDINSQAPISYVLRKAQKKQEGSILTEQQYNSDQEIMQLDVKPLKKRTKSHMKKNE